MTRGIHRTARHALAGLVAAAALAAPAQAAPAPAPTAGVSAAVLGITSGKDATDMTVTRLAGNLIVSNGAQRVDAGSGCSTSGTPAKVVCPAAGVTGISASLGDGDDRFDSSAVALAAGVNGGKGGDSIATGAASDSIDGSSGSDVVKTRDGAIDIVTCGTGPDSGEVDAADRLSADCEAEVQRAAPTPGHDTAPAPGDPVVPVPPDPDDTSGDPGDGTAGSTAADPGVSPVPTGGSGSGDDTAAGEAPITLTTPSAIALSPQGDITIGVACTAASGACRGTIELFEENGALKARSVATMARRRKVPARRMLGRARFTIPAGHEKKVRLRLDRNGRQRIIKKKKQKKGKTRARLVITVQAPDGTLTTAEKVVTIDPKERRTSKRRFRPRKGTHR
jgi:hypothetical protein